MGVYYFLLNDTKKEKIHYDNHIKYAPMCFNSKVHYALVNYMMQNQGDSFRVMSDSVLDTPEYEEIEDEYKEVDLKKYDFDVDIMDGFKEIFGVE